MVSKKVLPRRTFLRTVAAAVGASSVVAVLQACTQAPAPAATTAPSKPATTAAPAPAAPAPAATTAPAPAATAAPAAKATKKTVTVAIMTSFTTWDAQMQHLNEQIGFQYQLNEPLIFYKDEKMEFDPRMATGYTMPDKSEGLTWTFPLRQGVKFHDGTPFNAEAVDFSFKRLLDPATKSPGTARLDKALASIQIVDQYNVKLKTKSIYPDFIEELARVTAAMLSPTATKKYSVADYGKNPVGTGILKFREWRGTDTVVFEANPDYWGPKSKIDEVIVRCIPEHGARVAGLEAGEIDIAANIPPEEMERLKKNAKIKVQNYPIMSTIFMHMLQNNANGTPKKPFGDVRVRKALNHAVDKEAIIKNIYLGLARPTISPLFPGIPFRKEFPMWKYDPALAKSLLAEAGYANGFECKLWYTPYTSSLKGAVEAIGEYFKAVGVKVQIQQFESAQYMTLMTDPKSDDRDIFITQRASTGPDNNMQRLWGKKDWDVDNRGRYYNPKYDELVEKARGTFDTKERETFYAQAQQILYDDAADIWLWNADILVGMGANINGFMVLPDYTFHTRNVEKA